MFKPIKVVQCGIGNLGKQITKIIVQKSSLSIVGAVDINPKLIGADLGKVCDIEKNLGIIISNNLLKTLKEVKPDIVILSTVKNPKIVFGQAKICIKERSNVISLSCMSYPWIEYPQLAREVDLEAKKYGVTALGDGLNPGFIMDLLPIIFTGVCVEVKKITVHRTVDMSPYGHEVIKHMGAGIDVEEFKAKAQTESLKLHGGFKHSIGMIADALEWKLESMIEKAEPIIAKKARKSTYCEIKPGKVSGYNHCCYGIMNGKEVIELKLIGVIKPELDDLKLGDWILIEGEPNVELFIKRDLAQRGGLAGAAHPVNLIPLVVSSKPGLISVKDLPPSPAIR